MPCDVCMTAGTLNHFIIYCLGNTWSRKTWGEGSITIGLRTEQSTDVRINKGRRHTANTHTHLLINTGIRRLDSARRSSHRIIRVENREDMNTGVNGRNKSIVYSESPHRRKYWQSLGNHITNRIRDQKALRGGRWWEVGESRSTSPEDLWVKIDEFVFIK